MRGSFLYLGFIHLSAHARSRSPGYSDTYLHTYRQGNGFTDEGGKACRNQYSNPVRSTTHRDANAASPPCDGDAGTNR